MNYEIFIQAMKEEVYALAGEEVTITVNEVLKNNDVKRIGLTITGAENEIIPTIYLEDFYVQYQEGISIRKLAESVKELYDHVRRGRKESLNDYLEYEKIKEKLSYKLINYKENKKSLEEIPNEPFLDLALVPHVLLGEKEFGSITMQIRMEHLEKWGVSVEQLLEDAKNNAWKVRPLQILDLSRGMYAISNRCNSLGAAVVCYPHVLERMRKIIGSNYYILPSSIHEVILVPEGFGVDVKHMEETVKEMNDMGLAAEEVLSYHVYYYDGEQKEMRMVSSLLDVR